MQLLPAAYTAHRMAACTAVAHLRNPRSHLAEAGFNLHAAAARRLHHCLHGHCVSDSVPTGMLGMHPLFFQQLVDLLAAADHQHQADPQACKQSIRVGHSSGALDAGEGHQKAWVNSLPQASGHLRCPGVIQQMSIGQSQPQLACRSCLEVLQCTSTEGTFAAEAWGAGWLTSRLPTM